MAEGTTIRQAAIDRGHVANGSVSEEQLDELLDVLGMTRPPV